VYLSAYRTGETWRVPLPTRPDEVFVTPPSGGRRRIPVQDGRATLFGSEAGFYTFEAVSAGKIARFELAANLVDIEESSIAPKPTIEVDGRTASPVGPSRAGVRARWWVVLLLLAAGIAAVEWVTYHRRVTV
jgi:hypothetical protein